MENVIIQLQKEGLIVSIGRVTSDTLTFYIEPQQGKHWMHIEPDVHTKQSPNQVSLHAFGI